ncbi:MAG: hypothetical protein INH41_30925 [Myxococcaceae bacterium]|jgi:hypothetical protein|nr:hypothetical protein [Myxococcaceae bacterium]MCA3016820.1 hypothetical protein [Myxococcaceae bacterium]
MRLLVLLTLLLAPPSLAQRIVIAPFTGPSAAAARAQLVAAVCDTADCVDPAKVFVGTTPDWKKAKKESVAYVVSGAVAKKGKALMLSVEVLRPPGVQALRRGFPVAADGLAAKTLQQAIDALKSAFGEGSRPEAPEVEPMPAPRVAKDDEGRPEPLAERPPAPTGGDDGAAAAQEQRPAQRVPLIVAELGLDLLNRAFGYVQPVTSLRRYGLPVFPMAAARVELYPFARSRDDLLAGLGLEVSLGLAPWLRSRRESTMDDAFPTSTVRFDAGLAWRLAPVKTLDLSLMPLLGLRAHSFTVGPNGQMVRLDLLPNLDYLGLRVGVGFELGLLGGQLTLFGRFSAVPVFSSGEVISPAFFPRGSNFGLDGQAGLGVRVLGTTAAAGWRNLLEVRAAFDFTRYGLTFQTEPTDAFVAQGAVDQYLGGTLAVRFAY